MNFNRLLLTLASVLLFSNVFSQIIYINDSGSNNSSMPSLTEAQKPYNPKYQRVGVDKVHLRNSLFMQRYKLNVDYMLSLDADKLLQNFYYEAGITKTGKIMIGGNEQDLEDFYWGWESPMNQLRGHFLGHWLSAAALIYAQTGNGALKQRADYIVGELALCQKNNGGKYCGSIPEKYFELMVNGVPIWSPQYTLHKTLMGLFDMYQYTGNNQALTVLDNFADWFIDWTDSLIKRNKADMIYSGETSGMLEIWAEMYRVTKNQKYLTLIQRYGDPSLFKLLNQGKDALSNEHANASIPWSHGAAKVYEITGNDYWKSLVEKFWKCAVLDRESFCTGGQNAGEHWIPKGKMPIFQGRNNQELCTVYNMMRTADYLFCFNGDVAYADYAEKNLYNGILAQQHPQTGMVAYFLPMASGYTKGGEKGWGRPTLDFYCCHGSLVQSQAAYLRYIYYQADKELVVNQYIPSDLEWETSGVKIAVSQDFTAHQYSKDYVADRWKTQLIINAEKQTDFELKLRLPQWLDKKAIVSVNGKSVNVDKLNGYLSIKRNWFKDTVLIDFKDRLYTEILPGSKNIYAFMDGPVVLAAPVDDETVIKADPANVQNLLQREIDQEYKVVRWSQSRYKTVGQNKNLHFVPLYEIADQRYGIYFPIEK